MVDPKSRHFRDFSTTIVSNTDLQEKTALTRVSTHEILNRLLERVSYPTSEVKTVAPIPIQPVADAGFICSEVKK